MSELEGMVQMTKLEIEVGEKALKYSIDVFKFGISTIKKLAMLFAGLKYAKSKGLTNMDNLIMKTNGNTQLLQIPDELQKDFEEFCKKHGILISKMYDLNLKDGKKQYAIDANMADLVFNQFAVLAVEKYKGNTQVEAYKAQMETFGMELKAEYEKLSEAEMLLERMRHGMPENETDALAKALGYENADDAAFQDYMENKYGEVTMEAYEKEAEAYCERLENSVDWKDKEFKNAQGKYEAELDKIKNPVTAITWEDYINSNKCDLKDFEEITKRMAHGKDDGSYQKVNAAEAFGKNTIDIPETMTDHSYCPDKPDIVMKRSYSPEFDENGRIKGCSHTLECEVDGKKLSFNDKGLYGRAYQEGLENFLKEAGLSMEDKFVTIVDERTLEKYRSVDKEIKAEEAENLKKNPEGKKTEEERGPAENSGTRGKSPLEEEFDKRHNASVERQQSERARRLRNRDYVYNIQNPGQDVFFVKGDDSILRANVPLDDGQGNGFCIVEFDKNDILRNKDGSYSVYFNQNDMFKMYSYDEIGNDGTLSPSASPRMLKADTLKNSTYAAVNFKGRQNDLEHMGMEQKGMDLNEGAKMRKLV